MWGNFMHYAHFKYFPRNFFPSLRFLSSRGKVCMQRTPSLIFHFNWMQCCSLRWCRGCFLRECLILHHYTFGLGRWERRLVAWKRSDTLDISWNRLLQILLRVATGALQKPFHIIIKKMHWNKLFLGICTRTLPKNDAKGTSQAAQAHTELV